MPITPFKISIDEAQIKDLQQRLRMTRFPQTYSRDWSAGQPVHFVRELVDQWLNEYDWRAWETRLNT